MDLHRGFGDARLAGNLLVQPSLHDPIQNSALTRRQFQLCCYDLAILRIALGS